jgi:hypothetical protein
VLGTGHPDTLRSNRVLAGLLRVNGHFSQAESVLRETVQLQRNALGPDHPETLATQTELALALEIPQRFLEAETIHRQTLDVRQRELGPEHVDTLESMAHLGNVCRELGKLDEARTVLWSALETSQRVLGEDHPATTRVMNAMGRLLEDEQDDAHAETLYRQTYESERRILGPDHRQLIVTMNNLLRVLSRQGKTGELGPLHAERLLRLKRAAEQPGAAPSAIHAYAWELLSCETESLRDPKAALAVANRAVEADGSQDPQFLDTLAKAHYENGDIALAITTQRLAVTRARQAAWYRRGELEESLTSYLLEKGDLVAAAATAVSWESMASQLGQSILSATSPGGDLISKAESEMAKRNFDEAAATLRTCLAIRKKELPDGHWLVDETISLLGVALAAQGNPAEAESLLLDAAQDLETNPQAPAVSRRRALQRLVRLYESWDRPQEADRWRQHLPLKTSPKNS